MKCGDCVFEDWYRCLLDENDEPRKRQPWEDCTCNTERVARLREQLGPEWMVVSRDLAEHWQKECHQHAREAYATGCYACHLQAECERVSEEVTDAESQ